MGIAFFMVVAHTARTGVLDDFLFTATAVPLQPITGPRPASLAGYSLLDDWIVLSLALYVFTGACWLPVVVLQMRMRDLAAEAVRSGGRLPHRYHVYYRLWFALGWPAFRSEERRVGKECRSRWSPYH